MTQVNSDLFGFSVCGAIFVCAHHHFLKPDKCQHPCEICHSTTKLRTEPFSPDFSVKCLCHPYTVSSVGEFQHNRIDELAELQSSLTSKLRKSWWKWGKPLPVACSKCNTPKLNSFHSPISLKVITLLSCAPKPIQSYIENRVGQWESRRAPLCYNCGFTIQNCWSVSKRGTWAPVLTTAESPPSANKHKVSRDQLCVTQQHNQSVDIACIDSPQKSLLLFDDLLLPFVFSFTLTSIVALWFLCPLFNPAPTFTFISIF